MKAPLISIQLLHALYENQRSFTKSISCQQTKSWKNVLLTIWREIQNHHMERKVRMVFCLDILFLSKLNTFNLFWRDF